MNDRFVVGWVVATWLALGTLLRQWRAPQGRAVRPIFCARLRACEDGAVNKASFFATLVITAMLPAACAPSSAPVDASLGAEPATDAALGAEPAADAAPGAPVDDDASTACSSDYLTDPSFVQSARRSPDGQGFCCQPGYPTCDCGYFGGFVRDRCHCGERARRGPDPSPFGYCDLAPPDWILETDAHGCAAYHAREPVTACCFGCSSTPTNDAGL
jgi:hypothetical protein